MKAYNNGLYEKAMPNTLSWEEKLLTAKELGYDYIEISIDETDEKLARLSWSRQERLNLVSLMSESLLPIRSMCLSGHRKYPLGSLDADIEREDLRSWKALLILQLIWESGLFSLQDTTFTMKKETKKLKSILRRICISL